MTDEPLVSVVIPTYNAAEHIGRCLSSIENQSYDNTETIVVDAHSDDGTAEIVDEHDAELIQDEANRSKARNIGMDAADGEYVLHIDVDMELTDDVIAECLDTVQQDGVGGVIIPERSVGDSYWVKVRDFERQFYEGTAVESARFFPMELAQDVGGYDERLTFFEESTLPQRISDRGYNVTARTASHINHHEEPFSLWDWVRKKYYYGKTAHNYLQNYDTNTTKEQTSPLSRYAMFLTSKCFYTKPLTAAGVLVLKTLEYGAAGAGWMRG